MSYDHDFFIRQNINSEQFNTQDRRFFYRASTKEEILKGISFYVPSLEANKRDISSNPPVFEKESKGQATQVLFGTLDPSGLERLPELKYLESKVERFRIRIDMDKMAYLKKLEIYYDGQNNCFNSGSAYLLDYFFGTSIKVPKSCYDVFLGRSWVAGHDISLKNLTKSLSKISMPPDTIQTGAINRINAKIDAHRLNQIPDE